MWTQLNFWLIETIDQLQKNLFYPIEGSTFCSTTDIFYDEDNNLTTQLDFLFISKTLQSLGSYDLTIWMITLRVSNANQVLDNVTCFSIVLDLKKLKTLI